MKNFQNAKNLKGDDYDMWLFKHGCYYSVFVKKNDRFDFVCSLETSCTDSSEKALYARAAKTVRWCENS